MDVRRRTAVWVKDYPIGVEFAEICIDRQRLIAEGVAIGAGPIPYRLDYALQTAPDFITAVLRVSSRGEGWRRGLNLAREPNGTWEIAVDQHRRR